jgi:hypothetical protein
MITNYINAKNRVFPPYNKKWVFFGTLHHHRHHWFDTYQIYKVVSDTKYLTTSGVKMSASVQQSYKTMVELYIEIKCTYSNF